MKSQGHQIKCQFAGLRHRQILPTRFEQSALQQALHGFAVITLERVSVDVRIVGQPHAC